MLSGTGDVCREFMCSERLKDEVEQLLNYRFQCLINFYTPCQLTYIFGSSDPGYYFRFHYSVVGQSDRSEILLIP